MSPSRKEESERKNKVRGSEGKKEGGKGFCKGEVSFFCVSLLGFTKAGGGPPFSCSFGAASGQNRAGLKRTRTPDPLGCVLCSWSMCVAGVL